MFTRGQFGVKTILGHVSACLQRGIGHFPFVKFFIDDIVIFSPTILDHRHHVAVVLNLLTKFHLRLGLAKCHFHQRSVKLLGHIVSSEGPRPGLSPDPEKLQAISKFPRPTTPAAIQRFLGMVNYHSRHFPNLSLNAERCKKSFEWTEEHENAFQRALKDLVAKPLTLAFPDIARPIHLYTDASRVGSGCMLSQPDPDPTKPPAVLACFSRSTSSTEKNYSPTMLELASLVFSPKN